MPFNQAFVSRRFTWRLMILGTVLGIVVALFRLRWEELALLPFSIGAIVALHPLMDKDVPTFVDREMFRQPRVWVGIVTLALGTAVMFFVQLRHLA